MRQVRKQRREVIFKENDTIKGNMIKYSIFLWIFYILHNSCKICWSCKLAIWIQKLPDFYLIPKEQSAQREEKKKEVERIIIGRELEGGREGGRKPEGEAEAHHPLPTSWPPTDTLLLFMIPQRSYPASLWEKTFFLYSFKTGTVSSHSIALTECLIFLFSQTRFSEIAASWRAHVL